MSSDSAQIADTRPSTATTPAMAHAIICVLLPCPPKLGPCDSPCCWANPPGGCCWPKPGGGCWPEPPCCGWPTPCCCGGCCWPYPGGGCCPNPPCCGWPNPPDWSDALGGGAYGGVWGGMVPGGTIWVASPPWCGPCWPGWTTWVRS